MLRDVVIQAADYGSEVERILNLDGGGNRPMPLAPGAPLSEAARAELKHFHASQLFPGARAPEAALSGLYLYFGCLDEAHAIAQEIPTAEGSYWHGIMHRQEPDPGNAAYWFRNVGRHPIHPGLRDQAVHTGYYGAGYHGAGDDASAVWDPFRFIEFCESARRRPGSEEERIAINVQLIEWQLLFDYCARGPKQ